ncbi:MAG: PhoPQ-activated protein PqaA family protein [Gemmataceae bacterium]
MRIVLLLCFLTPGFARAEVPKPPSDLVDYVTKADKAFAWKKIGKIDSPAGTAFELELTSQKWQDITWTHKLQVFVPKDAKPQATMVLWNQGGSPSPTSALLGLEIAKRVGAPVAFLYGIPNQPLFEGKREDALIAETFVKYLETKDSSWPLLFPMVKSIVKTMDALQAFAKEEWTFDVTHFVVTGASKRGWTSWLTAATGDTRVKAIAPLVIDTLNMPVQMKNQVAAFGKPSLMIKDYTERNLVPIPETGEAQKLWKMVDPWIYRDRIAVPKMIINGANDPYWPLDALNSYWDDLKGEKHVLYVPNAGHDLREADKDGKKQLIPERAVNTLSAFCKCQVFDKKMPNHRVKYSFDENAKLTVEVAIEGTLKSQRIWVAESETRDFRKAQWKSEGVSKSTGGAAVQISGPATLNFAVKPPATGFSAVFVETEFSVDGLEFPLSTQLRILEAKK